MYTTFSYRFGRFNDPMFLFSRRSKNGRRIVWILVTNCSAASWLTTYAGSNTVWLADRALVFVRRPRPRARRLEVARLRAGIDCELASKAAVDGVDVVEVEVVLTGSAELLGTTTTSSSPVSNPCSPIRSSDASSSASSGSAKLKYFSKDSRLTKIVGSIKCSSDHS